MTRIVESMVALLILAGVTVVAADPVLNAGAWAIDQLDHIGAQERARQQQIQDVVCEANHITPCPTIPPWVPAAEQIRQMSPPVAVPPTTTSTTLLPPVTLPKLGL